MTTPKINDFKRLAVMVFLLEITMRYVSGYAVRVICVAVVASATSSLAQLPAPVSAVRGVAAKYDAVALVDGDSKHQFIYGTNRGIMYLMEWRGERYVERWSSPFLGARIVGVFVADIAGNGRLAMIAYTSRGVIAMYDVRTHAQLWKTPENDFSSITTLTIANLDDDQALELLFISSGILYQYDGRIHAEEWRSQTSYQNAQDIAVGDVDGDGKLDIVFNSGEVINAQYHDLIWGSPTKFGQRIELADVDGDGVLEILSEQGEGGLKIFDVDLRGEKWER